MKKILSLLLCLALVIGCLAGCGGATSESSAPSGDSSSAQESGSSEESQTAGEDLSGTITVNVQAGPGATEAWQAVADAYTEMHPGVTVNVDLKASEGYAEWIKAMFSSENPTADIISINLAGPDAAGKAINYMEYLYDDSPYSDGAWIDQFNFENQTADLVKNEMTSLSLESVQVMWFYNQEIFDQVGVTPPTTWDELIAVCEKLLAAGYQPLAVPGDFNSFWAMQMGWLAQAYVDQTARDMVNVVRAQPGDYCYDPEKDADWEYDPTDPWNDTATKVTRNNVRFYQAIRDGVLRADTQGMKDVWTNMAKVFPKYAGGDAFFGTTSGVELFYQGKAAMYIDTGARLIAFKNDMEAVAAGEDVLGADGETAIEGIQPFTLSTFNMPSMEGENFVAKARTAEGPVGFLGCVKKDKEHDALVMDFMMYLSSTEGYGKWLNAGLDNGMAVNGPPLVYDVELPEEYAVLFENVEFIGSWQNGQLARGIGDVQEALRDWYTYTQEFLEGKITIDEWGDLNQENLMTYYQTAMGSGISMEDLDHPENEPAGRE